MLFKESQALQKSWTEARDRNPAEVERLSSAWKVKNGEAEAAKSAFQDAEDRYQKRADQGSRRLSEFSEQVAARDTPITSYADTNATEFFAEAYAAWRADPEFLQANAPVDGTAAEPEKAESGAAVDRKSESPADRRGLHRAVGVPSGRGA